MLFLHLERGADWATREDEGYTASTGVNVGINIGPFCWSVQFGASIDSKGNHVFQFTKNSGYVISTELGVGVTAGSYSTFTNASDAYALEDAGLQIGGGASVPIYNLPISFIAEENKVIIPNGTSSPYTGHSYYKGVTFPNSAEIHVQGSYSDTKNIWGFNILDLFGVK